MNENQPGTFRIVVRELLRASARIRLALFAGGFYVGGMTGWSLLASAGANGFEPAAIGGILGGISGMVLGVSYSLFQYAQDDRFRSGWHFRLEAKRLHPMLIALPMLAFKAGALAAISITLVLPFAMENAMGWLAVLAAGMVMFGAIRGLGDATRFLYRQAIEQTQLAERAKAEATAAHLATLQAQINPHFLFNALNTIAHLVRTDPTAAERTVESLARVLRRTLDQSAKNSISIADEIDYLRAYLAIERARYGDRLTVNFDIADDTQRIQVPPLLLQPSGMGRVYSRTESMSYHRTKNVR